MSSDLTSAGGIAQATADATYVRQDASTPLGDGQEVAGTLVAESISVGGPLGTDGPLSNQGAAYETGGVTITGSASVPVTARVVLLDATGGNVTATLFAISTNTGIVIDVKRIDTTGNTATLQRGGADTIDGGTSISFAANQARTLRAYASTKWGVF